MYEKMYEKMKKTIAFFREFYETYGAPVIREHFPEYESRIAVGLVGEGSDAFGFDDEISRDHDFGLGFCMWLKAEDYAEIGQQLNNIYHNLLAAKGERFAKAVWGESASGYKPRFDSRRGAFEIGKFYRELLRIPVGLQGLFMGGMVYKAEERFLATAVNGEVFRDDEGTFSTIRNRLLKHYPESIRKLKLAEAMHLFSHGGQSNYPRMMARKDYVAARLALDLSIENAMHMAYLLGRVYMPYYKWQRRGLDELPVLRELGPILDALSVLNVQAAAWEGKHYDATVLNTDDPVVVLLEKAAALILDELNRQGIVSGRETFLEVYAGPLAKKAGEDRQRETEEELDD